VGTTINPVFRTTLAASLFKIMPTTKKQSWDKATQTVVTAITDALQREELAYPPMDDHGPQVYALDAAIAAAFNARQLLMDKALGKPVIPSAITSGTKISPTSIP
jgi:hypothetical protein